MTTKERLHELVEEKERMHRLVDELSELEAERALSLLEKAPADPLLRAVADAPEDDEPHSDEGEAAMPGDIIDDWGNLSAMKRASTRSLMQRLDEEEIAEFGETIGDAWTRLEADDPK
jgi:hypothetical protein